MLARNFYRSLNPPFCSLPVIVELDSPSALLIDVLPLPRSHIIANNLNIPARSQQLIQQRPNNRCHAAAQNNNRHIILARPIVKLLKAWVQCNILQQNLNTLVKGGGDAVQHLLERVSEMHTAKQDILVTLAAFLDAVAQIIRHVVIGIGGGDGAIEISEEDELGVGGERRGFGVDGTHCCGFGRGFLVGLID